MGVYYKNSYIILVSQSGCSTNIIQAAKKLNQDGERYVALTGNVEGDLKNWTDRLIEYGVGNETIDYVTLGLNTLIEFFMLFALETAMELKLLSADEYNDYLSQIEKAIHANQMVFDFVEKKACGVKEELLKMDKAIIVADYSNMGIAREGALKFQETLKVPALFYECEEYVHGPNMQLTPEYVVFFIDTNTGDDRILDVYEATGEITDRAYLVTNKNVDDARRVVNVKADVIAELTPLFTAVVFQYIAAHLTPEKNAFQCHPLFEKFEKRIHCKTDDYDEIMKDKIKKDKEEATQ